MHLGMQRKLFSVADFLAFLTDGRERTLMHAMPVARDFVGILSPDSGFWNDDSRASGGALPSPDPTAPRCAIQVR